MEHLTEQRPELLNASTLTIAGLAYAGTAAVAFAMARALAFDQLSMAFIVAAIVGSNLGPYYHHKRKGALFTAKSKAQLGAVFFVAALVSGGLLQLILGGIANPDIVLPIAALGSFAFPFALSQQMWKTLERSKAPQ